LAGTQKFGTERFRFGWVILGQPNLSRVLKLFTLTSLRLPIVHPNVASLYEIVVPGNIFFIKALILVREGRNAGGGLTNPNVVHLVNYGRWVVCSL